MEVIRNLNLQVADKLNVSSFVKKLTKQNLYVTGPGLYTYHLEEKYSCDHLYCVFGTKENLSVLKKLKLSFTLYPINSQIRLYTDLNRNYILMYDNLKPGLVAHKHDLCLHPNGRIITNLDLSINKIRYPTYKDWRPNLFDTTYIPLYLYFMDKVTNQIPIETYQHVLKEVKGFAFDDMSNVRNHSEPEESKSKDEIWNDIMSYL